MIDHKEKPLPTGDRQRLLDKNCHPINAKFDDHCQVKTDVTKEAVHLLSHGFSVIPVGADKRATMSWSPFMKAPMAAEEAIRLFSGHSRLAVICGAVSGNLECLDFDNPDLYGPFVEIFRSMKPDVTETLVKRGTPSGGYHLLYRCKSPVGGSKKLAMSAGGDTWIETRGEGAYFVTIPSLGYIKIEHELEDVPTLSSDDVVLLHAIAQSLTEEVDCTTYDKERCEKHHRPGDVYNDTVDEEDVFKLLESAGWQFTGHETVHGRHLTRPGKSKGTSATIRDRCLYVFSTNAGLPVGPHSPFSIYAYLKHGGDFSLAAYALKSRGYDKDGTESPADAPWKAPVPLPDCYGDIGRCEYEIKNLPAPIRKAAEEVARFAKVPVASPATIGLSCIATAIGKKAVIVERPGLEHHPSLFFTLIAPSGERKSPAFANMQSPLAEWSRAHRKDYEKRKQDIQASNEAINAALSGLASKAKKQTADLDAIARERANLEAQKKEVPIQPSLFSTDITEERLFQKMDDRDGAYAVLSGEGRVVFDCILGKYSSNGRTGEVIYLSGISGDTITRDRVGDGNESEERIIIKPCLNVCVMVQPDKYFEVARHKALRESGALARILAVQLPSLVGKRMEEKNETGLDVSIMAGYNDLLKALLDAEPPINEETDKPLHRVLLSEEAAEARRCFHNDIEAEMAEGNEYEDVRDIASKIVTQVAKIALVIHLADGPSLLSKAESELSLNTWKIAEVLGIYYLEEAIRIQRLADGDRRIDPARRILRWINEKELDSVTGRYLVQFGPRPRPTADESRKILDLLVDYGYLKKVDTKNGKASEYIVNPNL